jgi:hypothetical protein
MPCYRCGARQVDPVRGQSPWTRGVRGDEQVLVCPDCQGGPEWLTELDRCRRCDSVRLVRRLGEAECRECGYVVPPEEAAAMVLSPPAGHGLAIAGSASGCGPGAARSGSGAAGSGPGAGLGTGAGTGSGAGPGCAGITVAGAVGSGMGQAGLSEEVARALDRVLGRATQRPPASPALP